MIEGDERAVCDCALKRGSVERDPKERCAVEAGPSENSVGEIDVDEGGSGQISAAKVGSGQSDLTQRSVSPRRANKRGVVEVEGFQCLAVSADGAKIALASAHLGEGGFPELRHSSIVLIRRLALEHGSLGFWG